MIDTESKKCVDWYLYFCSLSDEMIYRENYKGLTYSIYHDFKTGTETACYCDKIGNILIVLIKDNAYIVSQYTARTSDYDGICETVLNRHVLNAIYRFRNPYLKQ